MNTLIAYNHALLLFSFSSFFVGLLVWLKRQDIVGRLFCLWSILTAVWGVACAIHLTFNIPYLEALFWGRTANLIAIFIALTWLHFCIVYANVRFWIKKLLAPTYILGTILALFAYTPWFIPRVEPTLGFFHYSRPGFIFYFQTLLFVACVCLGFIELYAKVNMSTGREKVHSTVMMVAMITAYVGGGLSYLPIYEIMLPQYNLFLMPVYPFVMAYLLIRHNLFDDRRLIEAAHRDKLAALGMLAASINHEIRSPLYLIQGTVETVVAKGQEHLYKSSEETAQKAREALVKVGEQARRVTDIMKQFSQFAKQQTDYVDVKQSVRMNEALDRVLPLIRHELENKRIALESDTISGLPGIKANPQQLDEIFYNLINNAIQALGEKGGEIQIEGRQQDGKIIVTVRDNGPGIPADKLDQIFEPFFTTKKDGTGLGLYITKMLVERNVGTIGVQSSVGQGTEFTLTFPAGGNS